MEARVLKQFTTPTHRFLVGQLVSEEDIDGALSFMELIDRGFLSPGAAEIPEPEPEAMEAPPEEEPKAT